MKVKKKVDVRNGEVGIEAINEAQVNNFVINGGRQKVRGEMICVRQRFMAGGFCDGE